MSKQDSHFFNNFSLILGILFAVTLGLFVFANHVGAEHQGKQVLTDPLYVDSVKERLAPVDRLAVAGQDNSAMKIESSGPKVTASLPADGTAAYNLACTAKGIYRFTQDHFHSLVLLLRCKWQERDVASLLDRVAQESLMGSAHAGNPSRHDL